MEKKTVERGNHDGCEMGNGKYLKIVRAIEEESGKENEEVSKL